MRYFLPVCTAAFALAGISPAGAETSAPEPATASTPAAKYTTTNTTIGTLLADAPARAILTKYLAQLIANPDVSERAGGMTLRELQEVLKAYAPDQITDEKLAQIDAELAALPPAQ